MEVEKVYVDQLIGGTIHNPHVKPRYKAKIASVSPLAMRNEFESETACFLGVSLENAHFTRPKLEAMLEWITRRFRRCTILIGDSIHRITLEATRGLRPEPAVREGLALGRRFIAENEDLVSAYGDRTLFCYETCGAIQATAEYEAHHRRLREQFLLDDAFRLSVESFAKHYHRRVWHQLDEETRQRNLTRSCEYFLEEFAVFACLQRRGLSVMVYPGAFSTLEEIAEGRHPGTCAELRALTIISLQIKRR